MYRVGIKDHEWLFITDGNEIFSAESDIRRCSKPPNIKTESGKEQYIENYDKISTYRINKLNISQTEFDHFCVAQGMEIKGCETKGEKVKKISGPAVVGGILGTLIGGPVGGVVGAGLSAGICHTPSNFNQKNIEKVFERAKALYGEWGKFDQERVIVDKEQQRKYLIKAQEKWRKYHRLRNISSIDTLDGSEFEFAIAGLYENKGYSVEITKASQDYGVDIIAKKGKEILAIQTKRYSGKVGVKAVQEVSSGAYFYKANNAIVVTNSFYTKQAKELAKKIGVTLINKKRLANMWESYHPSAEIPPFDIQKYESMEKNIDRELKRIEFASRNTFNRWK